MFWYVCACMSEVRGASYRRPTTLLSRGFGITPVSVSVCQPVILPMNILTP